MILLDVNVLVHAFHGDSPDHDRWRDWLDGAVAGGQQLRLCDHSVICLCRIATHPKVYSAPAPLAAVNLFVDALRERRSVQSINATRATWATFAEFAAADRQVRASLVPDAYLAALAVSHRCRLATADRGFGRFAGLDFFDPTAP